MTRINDADALYNQGNELLTRQQFEQALNSYDKALTVQPNHAEALSNRGIALQYLGRLEDALSSYDKAVAIKPDYADAFYNRGIVLRALNRFDLALNSYEQALAINPDYEFLFGTWLYMKMTVCDWKQFELHLNRLTQGIAQGKKLSIPFFTQVIVSSPALQKKAAQIYALAKYPNVSLLPPIAKHSHTKIKIAYFSSDFRQHPVAYLMAELFEHHDRSRFEIIAFSFHASRQKDDMRLRLEAAFDRFIDVSQQTDEQVVQLARQLEIDIAIDLNGFTEGCRPNLFVMRVAPIQASYLGYLGTMGADYMDYLLADKTLIPAEHQIHYSEKIVYLPNSFQVNDSELVIADKKFSRVELGLPERGFVFCCFNNNYKITPQIFDSWMRILQQVKGSILWLLGDNPTAESNLRLAATARGVAAERLIFAKRVSMPEYLARHRVADLFLNTQPYHAGATASAALWAGLPVLTCLGETFAGRMVASLLNAVGLPELITNNLEDYEKLAIQLATHSEQLATIKQKLANNRLTCPLFDTDLFTQHLEQAYQTMFERYQAGLKPEHIDVASKVGIAYPATPQVQPSPVNSEIFQQALSLHQQGQLAAAEKLYQQILQTQVQHADALHFLGVLKNQNGQAQQAVDLIKQSIQIQPDNAAAHSNLGLALHELQHYQEAIASYDHALAIKPNNAEAHYNRGNALLELKHFELAIACYDRALTIKSDYAEAFSNRGNALRELKHLDDALTSYERALSIKPNYAEALAGYAAVLQDLKRLKDAIINYERALAIKPDLDFIYGTWLYLKMNLCDWHNFDANLDNLINGIEREQKIAIPFSVLLMSSSAELQQKVAELYTQTKHPSALLLPPIAKHKHAKIKLAYFSADFRHHPVAYLTAGLFEHHDRSQFEVIAFSLHNAEQKDDMRLRLEATFDSFIDVSQKTDKEIVELARELEIDIAVDLNGCTEGCRTSAFAMRLAPIQVNYLGYSGTMGAAYMDYLIGDTILIPKEYQPYYTEKIAYLPNSYMANDDTRAISNRPFTRTELGLPEQSFVFCCFNNAYKITPVVFDIWMQLLLEVEDSVLWLSAGSAEVVSHLQQEATERGIAANRIIFAERLPLLADHLARHRLADLFLDTAPYNAHTTTSDALWAGLPVLTCTGEAYASRVAASLLTAIGLPELITSSHEDYQTLAIQLATQPKRLNAIKQKLADNRLSYPLFNTALFTQHIESAYKIMLERYQADLAPEHIYIATPKETVKKQPSRFNPLNLFAKWRENRSNKTESSQKAPPTQTDELFEEAQKLHHQGQLAAAETLYEELLKIQPDHAQALRNLAVLKKLHKPKTAAQKTDIAMITSSQALNINPNQLIAVHINRGLELQNLNRLEEALISYDCALGIDANHVEVLINRGKVLEGLERLELAQASYERALSVKPDHAEALRFLNALKKQRVPDIPIIASSQSLNIKPDILIAVHLNRGQELQNLGRLNDALASYDAALAITPNHVEALINRGNVLEDLERLNEALASYDRAISAKPDYARAHSNRGNVLQSLKHFDEAIASYERAIAIKPDYAEAFYNRGNALQANKLLPEALASYERALSIKPDFMQALISRGNLLHDRQRFEDALQSYDRALAIRPDYAEALYNRGNVLIDLKRLDEALISYERALAIKPDYAEALVGRGVILQDSKRTHEALLSYERALAIKPDLEFTFGDWLILKMSICAWDKLDNHFQQLAEGIMRGRKMAIPFLVHSVSSSAALQQKAAQIYAQAKYPSVSIPTLEKHHHAKIKLGYFSADFRHHPVAYLTAELFERHDRERFEVIAFSFHDTRQKDEMRLRLEAGFDSFIDVSQKSDEQIVQLARQLEIDIAIDLTGLTKGSKTQLFARRIAPIQVNYLGFSGTMGAEYMDYLLADSVIIPSEYQHYYTEKIAYLPNSYMVNDSTRAISNKAFTRAEFGLPEQGFVFCCFNQAYKITPTVFAIWMRLLNKIEASVLWLSENNADSIDNLQREAQKHGIAPERLIFAKRLPLLADHLARHRLADLFLDTLPYNAHTTSSDALWAGLPVLTCTGEAFASRVAASLLTAVGLPELITNNHEDYEALAIQLATHSEQLATLKQKLADNRLSYPLFNTTLFTQQIESAYQTMFDRYQADLPPTQLYVSAQIDTPVIDATEADALINKGNELEDDYRLVEALEHYERAISMNSNYARAYSNQGNVLQSLQRFDEALASYNRALAIKPNYAEALYNRGNTLQALKRLDEALDNYDRALMIKPNLFVALIAQGNVLQDLKQFEQALKSYDRALAIQPDDLALLISRGNVLQSLKRYDEALANYDRVLSIQADYLAAWIDRGVVLQTLKRFEEAVDSYDRVLAIKPDHAEVLAYRGIVLQVMGRFDEAIDSCERALKIQPDYDFLFGTWLHSKMKICDWHDFDANLKQLQEKITLRKKVITPFALQALSFSLDLQKKAASAYAEAKYPSAPLLPLPAKHTHAKIKLGYFSADFRQHPVAYLMAELFEHHDRSRFEVFAFSLQSPHHKDELRLRLESAFDSFIDVSEKSDEQVVQLARELEIDIAIDLNGFTEGRRSNIFAMRAAPIQVSYLGYLGTMGVDYIDYLLADSTLIPVEHQPYYSEKIAYLPHSFQVNDSQQPIADKIFTRTELGLPEQSFVFCCFNNNFKITPVIFDAWMRILHQVENSVLWLVVDHVSAETNLRLAATARGIAADRIIFAQRLPLPEYLARHRVADLFLDTQPYNAGATASAALWAGLPVLTYLGEAFAGRMGASLLNAIGLPELIADNLQDYENLAIQLATHPEQLAAIKQKLANNRLSHPLFDTALFTQHIEHAFKMMFERYQTDLTPAHIVVPAQMNTLTPIIELDALDEIINQGNELEDLNRLEEALASYDRAIAINPNYARAYSNRGNALQSLQRFDEALESYDQALTIKPDYAEAFYNRGNTLQALNRTNEALDSYDKAFAIKPNLVIALISRGVVLQNMQRFDEALASYHQALAIAPDYVEIHYNIAKVLQEQKRLNEALKSYDRALMLKADYAEALIGRSAVLQDLNRLSDALYSYEQAWTLQPDLELMFCVFLSFKMKLCDWRGFEAHLELFKQKIAREETAFTPFFAHIMTASAALQQKVASRYAQAKYPSQFFAPPLIKHPHSKIKLAYFSADFRDHAVAYLTAGLFKGHDRSRFEVIAFSLHVTDHKDTTRLKLESCFDRFIDVSQSSDEQIVQLARELEIDIAVDLTGFTEGCRTHLFAMRVAPIQVNYLGFSGTMGAEYMDYLLADTVLIPKAYQPYYTEKIAYLPNSYMVCDSDRPISNRQFTRTELGLPEQGFVFCCFNNHHKITPLIFDSWMRILQQVENSVLWLSSGNSIVVSNLKHEAKARGIAHDRLVFANRLPLLSEHLARHRLADLFLDTLPYNAHTTSNDALWAGLPVLTCTGEAYASRVAASLLTAVGLPELITTKLEDYEALAIQLATHPEQLAAIKQKLVNNRLNTPLFNMALFIQHIESAYQMMFERYQADLPPDYIYVETDKSTPVEQAVAVDDIINQGNELEDLNRLTEALACYDRAISINPNYARAYSNRGNVLQSLKRFDEALASYDKALAIRPDYAEAFYNRGNTLQACQRLQDAIASYDRALSLKPDLIQAFVSRGNALHDSRKLPEALANYDQALAIYSDYAEAYINRGVVLKDLKRYDQALASYERALSINPNYTDALVGRGAVFQDLKRVHEAITSYEHALAIEPNHDFLLGTWLHLKMTLCDWDKFEQHLNSLIDSVKHGEKVSIPFPVLAMSASAAIQQKVAEIYVQEKFSNYVSKPIPKHKHAKIKVGYFSADFRNHPVAYLLAGIFKHHDKSRFEVIAFSFSPAETKDEMRLKLEGLFDSFIDVSQQSDEQVVQLARQLEIDIAVDLNGFTQYARTELFALRIAPIQVNYLGYSGTTGAEYMDYLLADEVAIPSQYQAYYTEKIAYLPNSYMANDNTRAISERNFTRTELGLPEQGFVFCSFNNSYKITPAMFTVWMRILQQVQGSVLWLSESNTDVVSNLQREAQKQGITSDRLIFAKRLPSLADHLARHRLADLFLDTLPYNAHTTSSDALWAGLPVLTCAGVAFASRVAASLLSAMGLPELITDNLQDYEQLAIQLATQPEQLNAIKQKLADNRLTHPLFDTALFTQHIETAYQAMYDRYQGDLPPDHIKTNVEREATEIQASVALPDNATFLQAFELHQLGQLEQAEALYKATLQAQPQHAEALHLWGVLAIQRGQAQLAVDLISQSLNIHANNPEANSNIGLAFQALNRFDEALASYERALSIQANHVEALYNRGNLLLARKSFAQALADYDRVLNIQPNYAEALCNRGIALQKLNRLDEALASYDRALAIKPDYAEVLTNRGNVLKDLKRWHDAINSYDLALTIATNDVETLINRGNAQQELKRYDDALASYQRALVINPNYAEALCHQGIALQALNRWHEAVTSYEQALAIKPDYSEALCYRGVALQELKCWDEALASYERALAINPNHEFLFGSYLTLKMKICDWRDFEQNIQQLKQKIAHEEKAIAPFGILAVSASAALHKKVAEIYIAAKHPSAFLPPSLTKHSHSKIKLGYFSADFYHHATAHLMAELFERHDKSRFEIIAFSFNPKNDKDETRLRLEAAFDKFIDVSQQSDEQVVRLARELEIDIAVDLKGFTQYARLDLFAMRVAPIQVNYLGYPGSMGADYIDYLLADSILIPTEYQAYYSEKIVYLPNSYQVNDSTRLISDRQFTRAELGLPEQGFVFCCFNNNYKITPDVFDCWTRLLQQVEGSVLWLLSDNTAAETNLKLAATMRGINAERLVFAQRLPLHEHLARHRLADLFIDTLPCNAHTTASDALWAGLPVLTCTGEVFASRVAASLLNAIGLPELITDNLDAYEKLAIQLATHSEQLARLKQKLADHRLTSPLFDTVLFTQHIEVAYQAMYDRYQADLAPEHIEVSTDKAGDVYPRQNVTLPINTATFLQAVELHQQGQFEQAEALYQATVQAQPEHADALHLWGVLAIQRGQARRAVDLISQSLNITPNNAEALSNIGLAFQALNRPDEALASYERALSIQPNYVEALYNRGNLLLSCQRFDEALVSYDHALSIQANYAEILCNRGITLQKLKRLDEALVSYDQALSIKPDYAEVFTNRGNVLKDLKRWNEAINSYDCALAVSPNDVETLTNRGNVLQELKRYDEALANYERALTIRPDDINALSHRGIALQELHRWHEALSCYQKVLNIDPEYEFLLGTWLSLKMKICDWSEFDTHIAKLTQKIQQGAKASTPLFIHLISSSTALQKKVAEIYVQAKYPSALLLPPIAKHSHSKIKIAYFSADFRYHPVSYLTAELFARHDSTRFEVIAFSFSPSNDKDEIRLKLEGIFDSFIDVRQQSDEQVVRLARQMEIDIAIDLNGFTQYARTGLFAMRVAPIQVNYLGYLGTMGADYIDYLLADSTLIPTEHQPYYSEKIAYLPHSFQVNDSQQPIADKIFTRAELGLPEQSFVFCCFNNNFKITPVIFDAWMRILHQVENSVLWLVVSHVSAETNLRLAATARGIAADRIIFAQRLPLPEYLARHRVADLFLDTQPYNAGATASAALWAGLPVLTYLGETFAGRMGASLLKAIGLPELIANNLEGYEALAIQLATHPEQLATIKQKLADNRLTYPLFDTALFTQHIEAAYQAMFDHYQAGLAPDHIYVNAIHAAQIQPSPDNTAKFALAMSHHQQGQLAAAETLYQEILQAEPNHVDALHFLGVLKNQNGQPELAINLIKKSIQRYPNNPAAHSNLGIALQALNRFDEALMSYNQVLALTPDDIEILLTQGNLLLMLHRFNDALIYYDRLLAIDSHHAEALFSRANVLYQLKRLEEAVSSYDHSLAINPNSPEAYYNRGIALRDLNRINDAIASYQQALAIKPDYVEVHNNLASLLKRQDRFVEAIASYQRAITIKPDYVDAHCNLINLLNDLGRVSEAKTSLNSALVNIPDSLELHNLQLMLTLPMVPKTATESTLAVEQFDNQLNEFSNWLASHPESLNKNSLLPLPFLLAYRAGNHVQRLSRYGDLMAVPSQSIISIVARTKLKMVVISHHFRRHSVWDVITRGLLVNLDRSRFELVLYHLGNIEDQETAFAKSLANEWRDTKTMTGLNDWLSALRNDAPDIIFYPEIGMDPMTAKLAAHRIAPLQVASWGHPITTGLPTIDLYFSGELLESNTADSHYRERLIRLPSTACCTTPIQINPEPSPELEAELAQRHGVRFVIAQTAFKFEPADDVLYAEIASLVGNSTFILLRDSLYPWASDQIIARLEQAFIDRGLNPKQHLLLIAWQSVAKFQNLLDLCDVYLDCPSFSGYTTAWQAAHHGLPIVTLEGELMRQRLAAGLLRKIGITDTIANSREEYVQLAVKLAKESQHSSYTARREALKTAAPKADNDVSVVKAFEQSVINALNSQQ